MAAEKKETDKPDEPAANAKGQLIAAAVAGLTAFAGWQVAGLIAAADTGVALIAGMAIFPLVFAYGLDPAAGPDLIFKTLPIAFGQIGPVGQHRPQCQA